MAKSDEQWRTDNGVPSSAIFKQLHNAMDTIKTMLKPHNLRIRTKHQRGCGTGSYIWVESIKQE